MHQCNLQKVQQIAALAITGALRTSPNDYVDIHAGIFPIELALLKACHGAAVHALTLPSTNPIYQVVQNAKQNQPNKHPGPIDKLLKLFSLHNTKLETIYPAITLEKLSPLHTLQTDNSREASINSERLDKADFKIFSDGSGHDNGVGTSAILYEKGRACPLKSLKFFMGNSDEHNTYKAEIVGAILALWILNYTPATLGKRVSLYTDNQSLVTMLPHPKVTSGQYLLSLLHSAINSTGCRLTIKWISGHGKVKGNEAADRMAKDTATGCSSPRISLPHALMNPLPSSASALKQGFSSTPSNMG